MGSKGSDNKIQSVRFPKWMADAIQKIADKGGHTFTDVVLDLLRQELSVMGYTMGIGQEGVTTTEASPDRNEETGKVQ